MDKKLLEYILTKCQTTIHLLSKNTLINYHFLYQVFYSNRKLKDNELDLLQSYLKKKTTLTDRYIDMRINKIKNRNKTIKY